MGDSMKRIFILMAATTALAACNGNPSADKAGDTAASAAPAAEAAAPAAATAASLPEWLIGKWAIKGTSCADGSDSTLTITANEIQSMEEIAKVTKTEAGDAESVLVDVDSEAEGEVTKAQYSFAPADAGQSMTRTTMPSGDSDDYSRCAS